MSQFHNVQALLENDKLDGWLLWDFRRQNTLAAAFLGLGKDKLLSRRFFYWIPVQGEPIKIVHAIEQDVLASLPGEVRTYRTWQEYEEALEKLLQGKKRIAMEYSPKNRNPYVSKVDGGTLELVQSFGVKVESSANLLQQKTSVLDEEQMKSHRFAAKVLDETCDLAFREIANNLGNITEWQVQQFILQEFAKRGCETSDPPICAVNQNSANPHFSPDPQCKRAIQKGDFILIDLWCKQTIYADICKVGVADSSPTARQQEIFDIVKEAQDEALSLVQERFSKNEPVMGWEVDQKARDIIRRYGYGEYFIHRLGHNIGENDHGDGAHLDNFETKDGRQLLPGTCFSIEPGIYLPNDFGIRLEIDVLVEPDGKIVVTGGKQDKITCLLTQYQRK